MTYSEGVAAISRCGLEYPLFGGKNTLQKRFGTKDSVRCSEVRFSEVANVLQVWDFQSVTRTLSALWCVSALLYQTYHAMKASSVSGAHEYLV